MSEIKKKRYPSDRLKLHELLKKKEQELTDLEEEVNELRSRVRQADFTAISATAEMYNVSPEQFAELMRAMHDGRTQAVPDLPVGAAVPAASPKEEDIFIENEDS
ncbi:MAG: hypothetical protein IKP22_05925 [Clostridia bacterium]|nr:hypothetical protein [Clostridia bacterium]